MMPSPGRAGSHVITRALWMTTSMWAHATTRSLPASPRLGVRSSMRVALLVVAACTTSVPGVAEQSGRCTALEGRSFASLVEMECGLGPNGPVPCTWHLTFDAHDATTSLLYWQHSDTGVEAPGA